MEKDNREYRLLVIEDNAGDFLLIEEYLEDYMLQPVVVQAISARNAASIIAGTSEKFDIILLDLSLPDKSGEELIRFVLDLADGIPVLVLTGYTDMTFSIKSLSLGADDYLLKDELTSITLYKSIVYNLERRKNLTELKESEKRYSDLFHLSPLPMYVFSLVSLRFLDVNAAAIENYGYSKEEFLSMTLRDIRPDEDEAYLMEHINILKNAQGTHNMGVFRHKKKSNEIIQVEIKSSNIDYRYERAAIVLANDITDQLNYIQAIERQNETLRDIAWIQSHVVRAPLARVMGLAKIILDFKQENFSLDDINILKMIVESAEELDVIIKEVVEKSNVKL